MALLSSGFLLGVGSGGEGAPLLVVAAAELMSITGTESVNELEKNSSRHKSAIAQSLRGRTNSNLALWVRRAISQRLLQLF